MALSAFQLIVGLIGIGVVMTLTVLLTCLRDSEAADEYEQDDWRTAESQNGQWL